MLHHMQEPISSQDIERLNRNKFSCFSKFFLKTNKRHNDEQVFVDVYKASVVQCFIPPDFKEEMPLYFLDVGGKILVLFGQWVYDPHTLIAPDDLFEAWDCDQAFFGSFSLRCLAAQGKVLQLSVEGTDFVKTQKLVSPIILKRLSEYQFVAGRGATLIHDLTSGGLL